MKSNWNRMGSGSGSAQGTPYPKTLLSIVSSVGGLAVFLLLASSFLASRPSEPSVSRYSFGVDSSGKFVNDGVVIDNGNVGFDVEPAKDIDLDGIGVDLGKRVGEVGELRNSDLSISKVKESDADDQRNGNGDNADIVQEARNKELPDSEQGETTNSEVGELRNSGSSEARERDSDADDQHNGKELSDPKRGETAESGVAALRKSDSSESQEKESDADENHSGNGGNTDNTQEPQNTELHDPEQGGNTKSSLSTNGLTEGNDVVQPLDSSELQGDRFINNSTLQEGKKEETLPSLNSDSDGVTSSSSATTVEPQASSECDLYHGKWVSDSSGPLYTNNSCPVITQMQNCQGNGRPDQDYENWRWKPDQCDLPRFDPKKFLELMRGKTLAFIGDSVARNQMESLLCILWQFEVPKNRGNRRMQRYYFRSTSTMIVRIWSSWLVNQTAEPLDFAPAGVAKLHLDVADDVFMEYVPQFDVIVLSSGHWFAKQSVYVLNNEIVGGQLWWPDKSRQMKINNIEAFGISVETILTAMVTHPMYNGLTIVRSFSPDHYEGGAWNTGGSCTGKVKPAADNELLENRFTNIMHEKQFTGYSRAIKKKTNKSELKFLDITRIFEYRHDGHPGPYRSPDPNKITKRGPDGRPPPQDCLHWCMPGPVDTWNEMVFELIRREFEDKQSTITSSS